MYALNGWLRLLVVVAIVWAIPVAFVTFESWPTETTSGVVSRWANERIEAVRNRSGSGESHSEFRARVFGAKSDEDIAQPTGFDIATAVPVGQTDPQREALRAEVEAIDEKYKSLRANTESNSRTKLLSRALLAWALPLLAAFALGFSFFWVRAGFRRSES